MNRRPLLLSPNADRSAASPSPIRAHSSRRVRIRQGEGPGDGRVFLSADPRLVKGGHADIPADLNDLLEQEVEYVLITGTHEDSPQVVNTLYHEQQLLESFTWERLPHSYHGSGCTLAASIAGLLAVGLEPFQAINEAQDFTWNALRQGHRPGQGQYLPDRLFWSKD